MPWIYTERLKEIACQLYKIFVHPEQNEESREHQAGDTEILSPFGRLNDKSC